VGDVSSADSVTMLNGEKPGTYLVRFSSQYGFLAASFLDQDLKVKHTLIEQTPTGFMLTGDTTSFPTLKQVLDNYSNALLTPLRKKHVLFTFGELKEMIITEFLQV
jgi:hypothetical protein